MPQAQPFTVEIANERGAGRLTGFGDARARASELASLLCD